MVSVALTQVPSATEQTPLSPAERARLRELVLTVDRGMTQFLEVGRALTEIKSQKLYREMHCDFDQFCRDTFGLPRSHCETLVKSTRTAELLIQSGAQIPAGLPESCIRPVSKLPDPDLQTAVWKFVEAVSPAQGPTSTLVAKVVRTIKNAIAEASPDGKGPWLGSSDCPGRTISRSVTMTPVWQKKRLSRIRRLTCVEVQEAFARGEITARRADILSDLPRSRQKQALTQWLRQRESKARTYRLAAEPINAYLGELGGAKPALLEIAERVRTALES